MVAKSNTYNIIVLLYDCMYVGLLFIFCSVRVRIVLLASLAIDESLLVLE
jgi:hypothetical protein